MHFDIKKSNKSYINGHENYIVTSEGIVYLRIVGDEGSYAVMSATAGEDACDTSSYSNMIALNEAALRSSAHFGTNPLVKTDFHGREYVQVCTCDYISDAYRISEVLFLYLNAATSERRTDELVEVYSQIAVDESGEPVYLSDGMWLTIDGQIEDRGKR